MIKFSYDPEVEACYVTVDSRGVEERGVVAWTETISESPLVNLDYREDGSLYGIEILLPRASSSSGDAS